MSGKEERSTRERLLDVAFDVFAAKGYEGTSVRDICSRAGVNLAAVNYHWRSKEQIWQAVCGECARWVVARIGGHLDLSLPAEQAMVRLVDVVVDALVADPRPARLLAWAALQAESLDVKLTFGIYAPIIDGFVAFLERQRVNGALSSQMDVRVALSLLYSQVIFTFVDQAGHRNFFGSDVTSPEHAVRLKAALIESAQFLFGLRRAPAAHRAPRKPRRRAT